MKKTIATILSICLILTAAAALAEPVADVGQTLIVGTVTQITASELTFVPEAAEDAADGQPQGEDATAQPEAIYAIPADLPVYFEDGAAAALADVAAGGRVRLTLDAETDELLSLTLLSAEGEDEIGE